MVFNLPVQPPFFYFLPNCKILAKYKIVKQYYLKLMTLPFMEELGGFISPSCDILLLKEAAHMNLNTEKLRKKYMDNPLEGMTSEDIRHMSRDDLLNMDYFLNEYVLFDDEVCVEGFYIF